MNYCKEQVIPFILVVSRDDVTAFSKSQIEWFEAMKSANFTFYDDKVGMMREKIHKIFQSNYGLPQNLRDFIRTI
jgi:hypothetical protein